MAEEQDTSASRSEAALTRTTDASKFQTHNGETVFLVPWGWTTAKRLIGSMRQLLAVAAATAKGGKVDLGSMLGAFGDEIVLMISASALDAHGERVTIANLENDERFGFDDIIGLFNVVIRVNFIERPGMRKNLQALLGTVGELFPGLIEEGSESEPVKSATSESKVA